MTSLTLRPNSTVNNTGVVIDGDGMAHHALSDGSDSTRASFVAPGFGTLISLTLGLDDADLPSDSAVKSLAIRLRCAGSPSVPRYLGAELVGLPGTFYTLVNWATPTTVSGPVAPTPGLPGSALDGATLRILYSDPITATEVYEAYVDVVSVAQPTVSIPTLGTITDSNVPVFSWTSTLDAEGGPQTYYEAIIKRFDDDEIMASSGVLAGTSSSWAPSGAPLANDNYVFHVRVAQTVAGAQHWSDWETEGFAINVSPPATPQITAHGVPSAGRVAINVVADVDSPDTDYLEIQRSADDGASWAPLRTDRADGLIVPPAVTDATMHNLQPQPDGGAGWVAWADDGWAGGINEQDYWQEDDFEHAWRISDANPSAVARGIGFYRLYPEDWVPISPGTTATVTFRTRVVDAPDPSTDLRLQVHYRDADLVEVDTENVTLTLGEGVQVHSAEIVVPAGADRIQLDISLLSVTAGDNFDIRFKDIGVMVGTDEFHDGESVGWRWLDGPDSASEGGITAVYDAVDYEAPIATALRYRARGLTDYGGSLVAGAWIETTAELDTGWWLKHPTRPELNVAVNVHAFPGVARAARQGVHLPLGSSTPVIVSDLRGPLTGTVTLRLDTPAARAALDELLDTLSPLLLHGPVADGWRDAWVVIGDLQRNRLVDKSFIAETLEPLPFTVVERPAGLMADLWEPAA